MGSSGKIFGLFEKWGFENYIGEPVSQLQHAQQAAMLAERDGFGEKVVIGAFLHDIGHLLGLENKLKSMVTDEGEVLGTVNHEQVGETFLQQLGFPPEVTQFVRGH